MRALLLVVIAAGLSSCGPAMPPVQGYGRLDEHAVLTLCETGRRYEVVVTTSNATRDWGDAMTRARDRGEAYVDVNGHESTTSPSAAPARGPVGRMSVGAIRLLESAPDGC